MFAICLCIDHLSTFKRHGIHPEEQMLNPCASLPLKTDFKMDTHLNSDYVDCKPPQIQLTALISLTMTRHCCFKTCRYM